MCIGAGVLVGWLLEVSLLKTLLPGLITMKVNTAWGFLAAGLSLWIGRATPTGSRKTVGIFFAVGVLAIGCLTMIEHIFQLNLGIDELFFYDDPALPGVVLRGRMSPVTAAGFCLTGLSLCFLNRGGDRFLRWALWCAVPVMLIAIQTIIGYAYGVQSLYHLKPFSALALHTALAFFFLSASIMAAVPTHGFMKIITSATAGGFVARQLLPVILIGLFGLGWVHLTGETAGWYGGQFGLALLVLMSMVFCACIVIWNAGILYRVDLQRSLAEAEVIALNAGLERKVEERTQELQIALNEVKQLSGLLPICAWCKKIRDDQNHWQSVENYLISKTDAKFTHGICPECYAKAETD